MIRPLAALAALAAFSLSGVLFAADQSVRGVAHPQLWPRAHSVGLVSADSERFISELMGRMSLEDKVGQIIMANIDSITPEELRSYPLGAVLAGGAVPPLGGDDRIPAVWLDTTRAFHDVALEVRPGHTSIPLLFAVDAVHGNNAVEGATLFPHNIGLGATRDARLVQRIGEATAQETLAVGMDWAFAPTLAVPQDLRWGRAYESYSQDPAVVATLGAALVLGLQGSHVAATAKHFIGDGGTTGGIDQGDTDVSEQQLIQRHTPGYLSAINAGVMTVMASYSSWQGSKLHGNRSLLTDVLKQRLGFQGAVVGDWNGHAQLPGCSSTSCPQALNAGIDMLMAPEGWKQMYDNVLAQVRRRQIPAARLEDAVRRVLRVKVKLGLFEASRPLEGQVQLIGSPEHRALAREAVRKSLVLLKNRARVLPLRAGAHVLVAGDAADDIGRQCGGWTLTWQGVENDNDAFPYAQSIYQGLREALLAQGGGAELSADGRYERKPDVAIVVFGEHPYAESLGDLKSIDYQPGSRQDLALLRRLHAARIPVVAVLLSGRPLVMNQEIDTADAFVAAWLPGTQGGAVADVLIGDARGEPRYAFSGELSFAWPGSATGVRYPIGFGLRY
ncbi:MAG TPA: glycoside hydrolase family 3 protein [Steroidobacteraceae bacterium]|jgi:beta-glucosidase|nr:glycoside hydrolase family 3 protein [Steroidobacteraceae bacterium]